MAGAIRNNSFLGRRVGRLEKLDKVTTTITTARPMMG